MWSEDIVVFRIIYILRHGTVINKLLYNKKTVQGNHRRTEDDMDRLCYSGLVRYLSDALDSPRPRYVW